VVPPQSLFAVHFTQVFVLSLQTGVVVPVQLAPDVHWTQAPLEVPLIEQAGVGLAQSPAPQARHWPVAVLQIGVDGVVRQSLLVVHCTQAPESPPLIAHSGFENVVAHSVLPLQARQLPLAQNGLVAGQSLLPEHSAQDPVPLQKGLVASRAMHSVPVLQARHRPVAWLQNGKLPEQSLSVAHCEQAPLRAPVMVQIGSENVPWHSVLPLQARQMWFVLSQKGVVPVHSLLVWHDLHWLVTVSHCPPTHWLPAVHCTQRPLVVLQMGGAPVLAAHCGSPVQATQALFTHTGLPGSRVQSVESRQATQAPAFTPLDAH
jgi:hypothetical protein